MVCSLCNSYISSKDDKDNHTVTIKNGDNYSRYIYNHYIMCNDCYGIFKYALSSIGIELDGPENHNDIDWPIA